MLVSPIRRLRTEWFKGFALAFLLVSTVALLFVLMK
jgi:hypothetical protein